MCRSALAGILWLCHAGWTPGIGVQLCPHAHAPPDQVSPQLSVRCQTGQELEFLPLHVMWSLQQPGQPLEIHGRLLNPGNGCLGGSNALITRSDAPHAPGLHIWHFPAPSGRRPALTQQSPACSFDPASGASAEANNCAVAALAGLSQEDLLMAEWNNSIGRPCHYVCVDRAHHCLVLSIR